MQYSVFQTAVAYIQFYLSSVQTICTNSTGVYLFLDDVPTKFQQTEIEVFISVPITRSDFNIHQTRYFFFDILSHQIKVSCFGSFPFQ